jgi:hypothetical protein
VAVRAYLTRLGKQVIGFDEEQTADFEKGDTEDAFEFRLRAGGGCRAW